MRTTMLTRLIDKAGERIGAALQRFGIKRGIVALFAGIALFTLVRGVLYLTPG